ncbi:hypothetical protein KO02_17540 [Sphingobacterium sp. ML3W]|uniref:hypothetical protein n=1 Tax=Sphingobacterium sp. ML3W TaxID=1538644 RepID=UPI0004F7A658|nr:hypothetical protein [Sphingobacterium sp. ML3W]AIM38286.1 hypothetical protein KO02_17540 [Sphingobacterium sp. ML3W]
MQNLNNNTAVTMAQMAKYSPNHVERKFEAYRVASEQLDDLKRSERFFDKEFKGDDRETHLAEVRNMIDQMELMLDGLTAPKSIGILNRENSEAVVKTLCLMVNDLRKYFILDRMITKDGILALAPMIIVTHSSLTLEEIAICFCNAKKGFYGEDFQRMDGSTIMKWLKLYVEEKQFRSADKEYTKECNFKAGQDVGRVERGDSMEVLLKKATGAALVMKDMQRKNSKK